MQDLNLTTLLELCEQQITHAAKLGKTSCVFDTAFSDYGSVKLLFHILTREYNYPSVSISKITETQQLYKVIIKWPL